MGRAKPKPRRADDFHVIECPIDAEMGIALLRNGSQFSPKELAVNALQGMLPVGCIVRQFDNLYLYYDGVLYALDEDKQLIDDTPRFRPVRDGHEGRWVAYDPND